MFRAAEETLQEEALAAEGQGAGGAAGLARAAGTTIAQMRAAVEGGDKQALAR